MRTGADAECGAPACGGGLLVRPGEGLCFAEGFAAWLAAGNATLPLPRSQFLSALLSFASLPDMQAAYPGQLGALLGGSWGSWVRASEPLLLGYGDRGEHFSGEGVCALLILRCQACSCQACTALTNWITKHEECCYHGCQC